MPNTALTDLELVHQTMKVSGARVRVRPSIDITQAELLIRRGLAELNDEHDEFVAGESDKCLTPTQYGFDLILGRVVP